MNILYFFDRTNLDNREVPKIDAFQLAIQSAFKRMGRSAYALYYLYDLLSFLLYIPD